MVPTPMFTEHEGTLTQGNNGTLINVKQSITSDEDGKRQVSEEEVRQLIDAMQGNFNMVCDQLREA